MSEFRLDLEANGDEKQSESFISSDGKSDSTGKESDRRRFRILQLVSRLGAVSIDDLLNGTRNEFKNFRRAFKHTARSTLAEDFGRLRAVCGNERSFQFGDSTVSVSSVSTSPFAQMGYQHNNDVASSDSDKRTEADEKQRIGQCVVSEFLKNPDEVVYLSTGTTAFQVGLALVNGKKDNISVILTDNLPFVYLFCQKATPGEEGTKLRKIRLEILGGHVEWQRGDIVQDSLPSHPTSFAAWQCSTAVISATMVNPLTGQIHSTREPGTKERILNEMVLSQVIIPVIPRKIGIAGGRLIYDPRKSGDREIRRFRKYTIVTTRLSDEDYGLLRGHGYDVRETDKDRNHPL